MKCAIIFVALVACVLAVPVPEKAVEVPAEIKLGKS